MRWRNNDGEGAISLPFVISGGSSLLFWEKRIGNAGERGVLFYIKKFETFPCFLAFSIEIWYASSQTMLFPEASAG